MATDPKIIKRLNDIQDVLNQINNNGKRTDEFPDITDSEISQALVRVSVNGKSKKMSASNLKFDQDNTVLSKTFNIMRDSVTLNYIVDYLKTVAKYTVSEKQTQLIVINHLQPNEDFSLVKTATYKYLVKNKGKGTYGAGGSNVISVTDLEIVYLNKTSLADVADDPKTQTIPYGDIVGQTIAEWVNLKVLPVVIQPQNEGYTIFKGTVNDVDSTYLFVGDPGTYGEGYLQSIDASFQLLSDTIMPPGSEASTAQEVFENGSTVDVTTPIELTVGQSSVGISNTNLGWTAGESQFGMNNDGAAFNKPVSIPDGVADEHAVNKGQLETFNKIIKTGLLSEYRFDDSDNILRDNSGNGNNGSYIGSPTKITEGGFLAANGKYATGTESAISTAQTIYLVFDVDPDSNIKYHTILGNSGGIENLNISQAPGSGIYNWHGVSVSANSAGVGSGTWDTPKTKTVVAAVVIYGDNSLPCKIYMEGEEVSNYYSSTLGVALKRVGVPWFGNTNTGLGYMDGNIYYASTYSSLHTPNDISANTIAIKNYLINRGTVLKINYSDDNSINQLLLQGDSNTFGFLASNPFSNQLTLNETFNVISKGWPGINTGESFGGALGFSQLHKTYKSKNIASLLLGTNDVYTDAGAKYAIVKLREIAKRYKSQGWNVIVNTLPDRVGYTANVKIFNDLLKTQWVTFADSLCNIGDLPQLMDSSNTTFFNVDGTHFTDLGHTVIANELSKTINNLLFVKPFYNIYNDPLSNGIKKDFFIGWENDVFKIIGKPESKQLDDTDVIIGSANSQLTFSSQTDRVTASGSLIVGTFMGVNSIGAKGGNTPLQFSPFSTASADYHVPFIEFLGTVNQNPDSTGGFTAVDISPQIISRGTDPGYLLRLGTRDASNVHSPLWYFMENGKVIGTGTIQTSDDIEVTDPTKGYVSRSPDGTRYRIQVQNGGALIATEIP